MCSLSRLYVKRYHLIQKLCGGMGVTDIMDVMDVMDIMDVTDIMDILDVMDVTDIYGRRTL